MSNQPNTPYKKKNQDKKPDAASFPVERLKSNEYSVDKRAKKANQNTAFPSKNGT